MLFSSRMQKLLFMPTKHAATNKTFYPSKLLFTCLSKGEQKRENRPTNNNRREKNSIVMNEKFAKESNSFLHIFITKLLVFFVLFWMVWKFLRRLSLHPDLSFCSGPLSPSHLNFYDDTKTGFFLQNKTITFNGEKKTILNIFMVNLKCANNDDNNNTQKRGARNGTKKSHGKHITCNNKRQSCGNRLNKKCVASFLFIILQWFVNKHNDLAINQSTTAEKKRWFNFNHCN